MTRYRLHNYLAVAAAILAYLVFDSHSVAQQSGQEKYEDSKQMPEGIVGKRIQAVIQAINSNDEDQIRDFIDSNTTGSFQDIPMGRHLNAFRSIYSLSRGLEFYSIRTYPDAEPSNEVTVIVRNQLTQDFEAIMLQIENEETGLVSGIGFAFARAPKDVPINNELSDSEMIEELDQFVSRMADAEAFSGTVLVSVGDKVLFKKACGLASRRFNVANQFDTKFNLGSMNKMFTSVAVLQLVQQGKVSLDDPLSKFVGDDWIEAKHADKIKIKHLLSHTSGLGSYFNKKYFESSKNLYRELEDYRSLITGEQPRFEPGTNWGYSNTGMFLLGLVIEKASGTNYFDYIRENVSKPAGMSNTDCYEMDKPVPNLAIGYSKQNGEWTNNLYLHVLKGGPAGGGFSTAGDLHRFAESLLSHQLLDQKHTQLLLTPKPNSPGYGYGFQIKETPVGVVVGHGGGFTGINSKLDIYLDQQITVVVMSNVDRGAQPIVSKIQQLITRRK